MVTNRASTALWYGGLLGCDLAIYGPASDSRGPAAAVEWDLDPERASRGLAELTGAGIAIAEFGLGQPSLDEVFLALTGHPAGEATDAEDAA